MKGPLLQLLSFSMAWVANAVNWYISIEQSKMKLSQATII